jgi:hypothetical protein
MAWWSNLFGGAPYGMAPDVTVPIPPMFGAPPRMLNYGPRDFGVTGVHQGLTGTPFLPTMFDDPNTFRPGAAPGEMTVAPKPMLPRNPTPATQPPQPDIYQHSAPPPFLPGAYAGMRVDDPNFKQPIATTSEAPKPPSWYDRNKDWITMLSKDVGALGKGILSAPPGTNPYGYGFANVSEDREKRTDRELQRKLLTAQVGKAEEETARLQQWRSFLKELPGGHPLKMYGAFLTPDKIMDKVFSKPGEGLTYDLASGGWKVDPNWLQAQMLKAQAGATNVMVKTEAQATALDGLMKKYRAEAQAATDPTAKARLNAQADAIERQLTVGEKNFPEWYTKTVSELGNATQAASNLATLLMDPKVSRLNFNDRAAISQQFENLRLAYATLKQRGANFTETEQAMIEALAGGNPQSLINMGVRDRQDFVAKLRIAHGAMVREWGNIDQAFRTGKPIIAPFPRFNQQPQQGKKISRSGFSYETE